MIRGQHRAAMLIDDSKREYGSAMLAAPSPVRARAWLDDAARLAYRRSRS